MTDYDMILPKECRRGMTMTMTKEKFTYIPEGVCSKKMDFEVENGVITNVVITGGCPGICWEFPELSRERPFRK